MKLFSCLTKDLKTYNYFLLYLSLIKKHENYNSIFKTDSKIQCKELNNYLELHPNINNKLEWIKSNSINMRKYLNSLKLCAIIFNDMNIEISYNNFKLVCEKLNSDYTILETIFI